LEDLKGLVRYSGAIAVGFLHRNFGFRSGDPISQSVRIDCRVESLRLMISRPKHVARYMSAI
jgi:hypothetical protein